MANFKKSISLGLIVIMQFVWSVPTYAFFDGGYGLKKIEELTTGVLATFVQDPSKTKTAYETLRAIYVANYGVEGGPPPLTVKEGGHSKQLKARIVELLDASDRSVRANDPEPILEFLRSDFRLASKHRLVSMLLSDPSILPLMIEMDGPSRPQIGSAPALAATLDLLAVADPEPVSKVLICVAAIGLGCALGKIAKVDADQVAGGLPAINVTSANDFVNHAFNSMPGVSEVSQGKIRLDASSQRAVDVLSLATMQLVLYATSKTATSPRKIVDPYGQPFNEYAYGDWRFGGGGATPPEEKDPMERLIKAIQNLSRNVYDGVSKEAPTTIRRLHSDDLTAITDAIKASGRGIKGEVGWIGFILTLAFIMRGCK